MKKPNITADELRKRLHYNPETGIFTWLPKEDTNTFCQYWNNRYVGNIAGTLGNHGYPAIYVSNKLYLSHRLAWLYMTGEWPKNQIDHINMIRADCRFANLREATQSQNYINRISYKNSTHGFKGIYFHKKSGLWHSSIMRNRKKISLGYHKTPEEAAAAYAAFTKINDGDFSRV